MLTCFSAVDFTNCQGYVKTSPSIPWLINGVIMKLKIEDLTVDSFAPFGEVITQPARGQDAQGPGWTWWGENHILAGGERNYAIGFLDLVPAALSFNWAER